MKSKGLVNAKVHVNKDILFNVQQSFLTFETCACKGDSEEIVTHSDLGPS